MNVDVELALVGVPVGLGFQPRVCGIEPHLRKINVGLFFSRTLFVTFTLELTQLRCDMLIIKSTEGIIPGMTGIQVFA